jgi:hypothetical protein
MCLERHPGLDVESEFIGNGLVELLELESLHGIAYVRKDFERKLRVHLPCGDKLVQGIGQSNAYRGSSIELVIMARHGDDGQKGEG